MTRAKRRRAERAAKMRAAGPGWSGVDRTWSGIEPLGNPQVSTGGPSGPRGTGDSGDLIEENTNQNDSSRRTAGDSDSNTSYPHVRLENKADHPDHPDQTRKSASLRGPGSDAYPDRSDVSPDRMCESIRLEEIVAAVRDYFPFRPIKLSKLCRAIVAAHHPLAVTPVHEFIATLSSINLEFEGAVRWAARRAINAGTIPRNAVDLRDERDGDLF
jgi:hypothetical protein